MIDPQVTIFAHAKEINKPFYLHVSDVLARIKNGKQAKLINSIRNEGDKAKKRNLKATLPCICFSGTLSKRTDDALIKHSGLVILDFDHLEDMEGVRKNIVALDYVYACFTSPSGDGLKVLVRIPDDPERHAGHYRAILKVFPELDSTSKNISRVCYESYDPDIYINTEAREFIRYEEDLQKAKPIGAQPSATQTNYNYLNIAVKKVRMALDGNKHDELLKAARLMGGYIASGLVEETEAKRVLEMEISKKDVDDIEGAKKTIADGIENGKINPITRQERAEKVNITDTIKSHKIFQDDENFDFLADESETMEYLETLRNGTFKLGLSTGIPKLDEYFRRKAANVNVFNGHDNVGKSTILWYLNVLAATFHNWKFIIFSAENKAGGIFRKLIEFSQCKAIVEMTDHEFKEAYKWVNDHFTILKSHESYTYKDILAMATKLFRDQSYDGLLIDPYNSLHRDKDKGMSVHDYDYEVMGDMRQWASKHNCEVTINCHVSTEALRRMYPLSHTRYAGLPMPPQKADTEGGGKFGNRCDDFGTIHRMSQHPDDWMWNEIHIRKVREMETGGKPTIFDAPVRLRMLVGGVGFETEDGFNPIKPKTYSNAPINYDEPLKEQKEFDL